MKKFIKDLFTKPVRSTEFNPGRRNLLGGAAVGAAAVAVGAKHAVKQAPEVVSVSPKRTKKEEELIYRIYKRNDDMGMRKAVAAVPVSADDASKMKRQGMTRREFFKSAANGINPRFEYPSNREHVTISDYVKSGLKDRFTVARVSEPDPGGEGFHLLPANWKPPTDKKITSEEAARLFPRGNFPEQGSVRFYRDQDIYDVLEMQDKMGGRIVGSQTFDSTFYPVRPNISALKVEGRKRAARLAKDSRHRANELIHQMEGGAIETPADRVSWRKHFNQKGRDDVAAHWENVSRNAGRLVKQYRQDKRDTAAMYKGE